MEQKELRGLEDRCIQEYAPPCTAACPIHVDVRGMMSAISRGDLEAALKIVRKALPFPGIIGRICEQPCRAVCNRKNAGGSLAVAALERACADLGAHQPEKKPRHAAQEQEGGRGGRRAGRADGSPRPGEKGLSCGVVRGPGPVRRPPMGHSRRNPPPIGA